MPPRPCIQCGTPTTRTRCPACERTHQAKRNARRPWYQDPHYQATRHAMQASLPLTCHLCREPITTPQDLHVDHDPPAATVTDWRACDLKPSHAACNLQRGQGGHPPTGR